MSRNSGSQVADRMFNVEQDLSQVVNVLTRTDDSLAEWFHYQRSAELLSTSVEIQASNLQLGLFCSKTGKPLEEIDIGTFSELQKIHGKNRARHILEVLQIGKIDPLWLYTDGDALKELLRHDPYGYFVYSCCNILIPERDKVIRDKDVLPAFKHARQMEWLQEKISCWKNIQSVSIEKIYEANQIMTKFLSVFRTNKVYAAITFKDEDVSPSSLCVTKTIDQWIKDIRDSIAAILLREVKARRISRDLSMNDISNLHDRFHGYSNFRAMRGKTRISENEQVLLMLEDFIPEETKAKYRDPNTVFHNNMHTYEPESKGTRAITPKKGFKLRFKRPEKKEN